LSTTEPGLSTNSLFLFKNTVKTHRTFYSSQGNPSREGEIFEAEFEKEADENKRLK